MVGNISSYSGGSAVCVAFSSDERVIVSNHIDIREVHYEPLPGELVISYMKLCTIAIYSKVVHPLGIHVIIPNVHLMCV